MKKVLFDSDVIIDVISRREPFFTPSFQALNLVNLRLIQGYTSAHAVTVLLSWDKIFRNYPNKQFFALDGYVNGWLII